MDQVVSEVGDVRLEGVANGLTAFGGVVGEQLERAVAQAKMKAGVVSVRTISTKDELRILGDLEAEDVGVIAT